MPRPAPLLSCTLMSCSSKMHALGHSTMESACLGVLKPCHRCTGSTKCGAAVEEQPQSTVCSHDGGVSEVHQGALFLPLSCKPCRSCMQLCKAKNCLNSARRVASRHLSALLVLSGFWP